MIEYERIGHLSAGVNQCGRPRMIHIYFSHLFVPNNFPPFAVRPDNANSTELYARMNVWNDFVLGPTGKLSRGSLKSDQGLCTGIGSGLAVPG